MNNRKKYIHLYWMPAMVFLLGTLAFALILWANNINDRQRSNFVLSDTIMDLRVLATVSHLWLEEALTVGDRPAVEGALSQMDEAIAFSDAVLHGGVSEHGRNIEPVEDPMLRQRAEEISGLLKQLKSTGVQRYQKPHLGKIGSPLDLQFNEIFRKFEDRSRAMELIVERGQIEGQKESRRLFLGMFISWALLLALLTAMLSSRELKRKQAEEDLQKAKDELEIRVEERTRELVRVNDKLGSELRQRKLTEEVLMGSESRFKDLSEEFHILLESIEDPLTLLSPDLEIQWANRSAARLSGNGGSSPEGKNCYSFWHKRTSPCEACPVLRSFGSAKVELANLTTPDGRLWEMRAFPVRGEEGSVTKVLEIAVDITEKVTLQAEAMRSAHLASIGELAAGVAHEINNPMNGIINYARIIMDKSAEGSREQEIAGRIIKEGNRVDKIVGNLLFFAREMKEERLPVNLHDVLSSTLTLTEAQLKKEGIVLAMKVPDKLPFVTAQAQQLEQVFLNLISNARYALNERFPEGEAAKLIEITGEEISRGGRPYVRATFLDHGAGIPAELLDKVMDPFFSTKPPGKGTGLGLSISHGIIADHGGRIAIESSEGQYTRVIVELPAKPA